MLDFFCWGKFFAQKARNFRGKSLSLLLIFKFPPATEIDEICRGVVEHLKQVLFVEHLKQVLFVEHLKQVLFVEHLKPV